MEPNLLYQAMQYRVDGKSLQEIHTILSSEGFGEDEISDIIYHTQKVYHAKIRNHGFIAILIGAAILLIGFFILLSIEFDNPYFEYVLYGLNIIGATLVFYGLVKILGW
ncbi:MAG: hypothetical protein SGJ10_01485 [Bacteroidota bacterium]|nr:hypothetical protein [Bacteroidota bacterium]